MLVNSGSNNVVAAPKIDPQLIDKQMSPLRNKSSDKGLARCSNINYFLCSIESVLPIDSIKCILEEASVKMDGIHFTQPDGNFKAKKYLQVNFNNPTHLFHFKNTFEKSYLNGCWFLTTKIPRLRSKQLEEDKHNLPLSNVQVPLTNNFKRKFYQTNTTRVHNHFNQNANKGNFQHSF